MATMQMVAAAPSAGAAGPADGEENRIDSSNGFAYPLAG